MRFSNYSEVLKNLKPIAPVTPARGWPNKRPPTNPDTLFHEIGISGAVLDMPLIGGCNHD